MEGELGTNGNMTAVYIFSIIAIFILFLACINFINLATARSVERAREVGIRKTFGSERKALVGQFLIESTVISFISVIVAFGLIALLLPLFNQLSGKSLSILYFVQPLHILSILAFAIVIGLIAGSYPAFVLSSFKPIMVLKGRFKSQKSWFSAPQWTCSFPVCDLCYTYCMHTHGEPANALYARRENWFSQRPYNNGRAN